MTFRCRQLRASLATVPVGLAAALTLAASGAAPPRGARILEDFETPSAVRVVAGRLLPVRGGQSVTHGKQAGKLPGGAAIALHLGRLGPAADGWLALDTLTTQPLAQALVLTFGKSPKKLEFRAHVRPGSDRIRLPLPVVAAELSGGWPTGGATLTLANPGESAILLDHVRLEPPAAPPPGSVLLDFGPRPQGLWPGFQAAGTDSKHLLWSGAVGIYPAVRPFPDPLTGDFVGPYTSSPRADHFTLVGPSESRAVGWLWVTHYVARSFQPVEYSIRLAGRPLKQRRLSLRQMLGPEGLLEGMGGRWTAEWFDRTHAPRLVDRIPVSLGPRGARVDLTACQVAALAMAPAAQRAGLDDYVRQVQADLSRYRRQFVLGVRQDDVCALAPTKAEAAGGLMVFRPPPEGAFSAGWTPRQRQAAAPLRALAANGSLAVMALAVVPTEATASLSVGIEPLLAEGRRLQTAAPGPAAWLLERAPYVRSGEAIFQPWRLRRKLIALKAGEVVHVAVCVPVSSTAADGVYRGSLRLACGRRTTTVPMELEVMTLGPVPSPGPVFTQLGPILARDFLGGLAHGIKAARRGPVLLRIRRELLRQGLTSLLLAGPTLRPDGVLDATAYLRDLQATPVRAVSGPTFVDVHGVVRQLGSLRIAPGSSRYRRIARGLVAETGRLAARVGLRDLRLYLGYAPAADDLPPLVQAASVLAEAGGRPALGTSLVALGKLSDAAAAKALRPLASVTVFGRPDITKAVRAFKALGGERQALRGVTVPDRYECGFWAAAAGTDGVHVNCIYSASGHYSGCTPEARGLLVPRADGSFDAALPALRLRQAREDFLLFRRAEQVLQRARDRKVRAPALERLLRDIGEKVRAGGLSWYDPERLRTGPYGPAELEAWRDSLIRAAAAVAKETDGRKDTRGSSRT